MGWLGRADFGASLGTRARRARGAGSPRHSSLCEGGSRGDLCSTVGAPRQRAAGQIAPRASALLPTLTATHDPYHSERTASRRRVWSSLSLLPAKKSSSDAVSRAAADGRNAYRDDLRRSSIRVSERGRPRELGDASSHAYEGSQAYGGRARGDVRINWSHLLWVDEAHFFGGQTQINARPAREATQCAGCRAL